MTALRPLKQTMLQRTRTAPVVRAALTLAVVLAVGASFGLHPEPSPAPGASRAGFFLPAPPTSPHGCVACLAHGLVVPAPLSISLAAPAAVEQLYPSLELSPDSRLSGGDRSGRSPPAQS
jgi:hypothetical protein